jgi:hypothetical protein
MLSDRYGNALTTSLAGARDAYVAQSRPTPLGGPKVLRSNFGEQFRSSRSGYVRFSQCLHCSSGLRELAEKRFRISKVGRVEIFGEVAVNPRQQVMCVFAFI